MGPTSTSTSSVKLLVAVLLGLILLSTGVQGQSAGGRKIGDRKCFFCHQDQKKSFPLSIHGGLGGEKDSVSCELCHGPGEEHLKGEGDTGKIVVFSELTAEAASRRCLTCHEKTARKGGHLDGFLASSFAKKGLGCTSCHQAHAPAAAAAAPEPSKRIGTGACLVCHSDHREYSHREQAEEMLGCETCHGPGRAHAEARGDATRIRNPGTLAAPASNRACLLCHSDRAPPDHPKKPVPGKNRCADCHEIHGRPELPAPAPEALPGKPPFRLEGVGEAPGPGELPGPFLTPSLPAVPEGGPALLGIRTSGEIRLGYRSADVVGNGRVYDQDDGFDTGFRIFDFDVSGEATADPGLKFRARGSGVDDPVERYSFEVGEKDVWSYSADWSRTNLVYHASGDPREQSSRKDRVGSEFAYLLAKDLKLTAGADLWWRDGRLRGARLVSGGMTPSEEPFDEAGGFAYVRIDWAEGPFRVAAQQGYRWEDLESGIDAGRAVSGALDYHQATDVTAPVTTLLAEYVPEEGLVFDGKVVLSAVDTETDSDSKTVNTGSGFVEKATGGVDGDRQYVRGEIGATYQALPELTLRARIERYSSEDETDGEFRVRTNGAPSREREALDRDQDRWRVRGEAGYVFADWATGRLGYEWMGEDYDVKEDGKRETHDSSIYGPLLEVEVEPVEDLRIEGLFRFLSVDEPFTEVGTQDEDQARLKLRYRFSEKASLSAFAGHREMTDQRHDTKVRAWSTGLSGVLIPFEELVVEAGFDHQIFDADTETVRFRGGVPEFDRSRYDTRSQGAWMNLFWEVTPRFRLRAGGSYQESRGDFDLIWFRVFFGAEYRFRDDLTIGTDLSSVKYDEAGSDLDDYKAWIIEMWLRVGF